MKIAVIGAGAIGNLVAGYLKQSDEDVSLIGRRSSVEAIKKSGLRISGVRGDLWVKVDVSERLFEAPEMVVLAVKTQDINEALKSNSKFLQESILVTTQNGIQADSLVSGYIPIEHIVSSIVMFGATYGEPARVVHNFEGDWIIGKMCNDNDEAVVKVQGVLNKIFPTHISSNIRGMKYLKVFVNANNCIPAILGVSMQEAFRDLAISRISIALWEEGIKLVNQSGTPLVSLPNFPVERLTQLTSMQIDEAAKIFSGIMVNLSKEPLYGSILQSIKRGRPSEIDYINGEFVRLAADHNISAPLNKRMVELVHEVERTGRFFTKQELISETVNFIQ